MPHRWVSLISGCALGLTDLHIYFPSSIFSAKLEVVLHSILCNILSYKRGKDMDSYILRYAMYKTSLIALNSNP